MLLSSSLLLRIYCAFVYDSIDIITRIHLSMLRARLGSLQSDLHDLIDISCKCGSGGGGKGGGARALAAARSSVDITHTEDAILERESGRRRRRERIKEGGESARGEERLHPEGEAMANGSVIRMDGEV